MKIEKVYIPKLKCFIQYSIGTNAVNNFEIIDDADENDLWFHVNNLPSCHVIAKIPSDIVIERKNMKYIVKQGALLCKQYSKYKSEKNVQIVFTKIKNIQKTNVPGSVIIQGNENIIEC